MPEADTGLVIVNFNSGDCLRRCISSVLRTDIPLRIVVVDNHSADGSLEGIDEGEMGRHRIEIVRNTGNLGFSKAVNQGTGLLQTPHVMLLNPDCTVFPHTLRKLRQTLEDHPRAGVVGALVFNEDGTEQRGCRRNEPDLKKSAITALGLGKRYEGVDLTWQRLPSGVVEVDAVSGAAMMIRRSCLGKVGGMDEDYFLHCEDLDICRMMRDLGHLVVFNPDVSVFHRKGASGKTSSLRVEYYKHRGMTTYHLKHRPVKQGKIESGLSIAMVWAHFGLVSLLAAGRGAMDLFRRGEGDSVDTDHMVPSMESSAPELLVTGARSDVGDFLLDRLQQNGTPVIAVTRDPSKQSAGPGPVKWFAMEYLAKAPADDLGPVDTWINLAPVWTGRSLDRVVRKFRPGKIIALSSTSVIAKQDSDDEKEQSVVERMRQGEQWLQDLQEKQGIATVILRPTMIYGGPRNQNINFIRDCIRFFRCFPMIGSGQGLRQPVHADDVARACLALMPDREPSHHVFTLGGGEIISYREMVERIFSSMNIRPRLLTLPASTVRGLLSMLRLVPGLGFLSPEMAERMQRDLVYPADEAVEVLGFSPRGFEP